MGRGGGARAPRGKRWAGGRRAAPGGAGGSPAAPGTIPRVLDSSPGAMVRLFIAPSPVTDKARALSCAGPAASARLREAIPSHRVVVGGQVLRELVAPVVQRDEVEVVGASRIGRGLYGRQPGVGDGPRGQADAPVGVE